MSIKDWAVIVLVLLGLLLLPRGERNNIASQCRQLGAFEADGSVFKCKEKVSKP